MRKAISYLKEKNMYLEKFMGLNREWLERLVRGDFAQVEDYRQNREEILNIVKYLDEMIHKEAESADPDILDESEQREVIQLLDRKEGLVRVILGQDLDIMQIIDAAKSTILKELRTVERTRKTHESYHPQERIDLLDEEA